MKKANIVLTGGGTGGHIYPCLAIAEELREQVPECKLYYIGNHNKLEASLLQGDNCKDSQGQSYRNYINFIGIEAWPFVNKVNPLKIFSWLIHFVKETLKVKSILQKNNIDIIFGTGGYVAAPVFAAAQFLGIPYIIHNLDAHIGLANRLFIKNASILTTAFPGLAAQPKNGRVFVTGNPISRRFLSSAPKSSDDKLRLLITGGSQGAESINNAIGNLLPTLCKLDIEIVHITGEKPYQEYLNHFLAANPNKYPNYKVLPYTHEMPELCSWADVAICRSGAMTIAEFGVSGVVSIFVPLPWAAHDHQTLNAQALVDANAAYLIKQPARNNHISESEFQENLYELINNICLNKNILKEKRKLLMSFAKPNASKELKKLIMESAASR